MKIYSYEQLRKEKEIWDEIHENSCLKSPYLTHHHVLLWYRCFSKSDEVRVYKVIHDCVVIGFLPLQLKKGRNVRILSSLSNFHCLHAGPLIRKGCEDVFSEILVQEIKQDASNWDICSLEFSYSFFPTPGFFSDKLLKKNNIKYYRAIIKTYSVSLDKNFEEYINCSLSKNARINFRRKRNKLSKKGKLQLRHFTGEEAIAVWPVFLKLESSGWKGDQGTSIDKLNDEYQDYYQGWIRSLADSNSLIINLLMFDDKPIAGAFGYVDGNIFHWAKAGFDVKWRNMSPSNLLQVLSVEHMIANYPDLKIFHMFPWDYGYKHRYANMEGSWINTIIYSRTIRGRIAYVFRCIKEYIKHSQLWEKIKNK